MLPWPEIITTGSSGCAVLTISSTCSPSSRLPCSQMSRKIELGPARSMAARRVVGGGLAVRVAVAFVLEDAGDQVADVGFVVDDRGYQLPCACLLVFGRRR